jgi:hypothetical protein
VLEQVDAADLVVRRHPQADGLGECEPDEPGHDEGVREDRERTERLGAEQVQAATVEQAVLAELVHPGGGEEADPEAADEATHEVDADDVQGVVVAEAVLQAPPRGSRAHQQPRRAPRPPQGREEGARRRDRDEPATAPDAAPRLVGCPSRTRSTASQPRSAAAVATIVLVNATAAVWLAPERSRR